MDQGHAQDRRGFGAIGVASGRGLRCRSEAAGTGPCDAVFHRPDDDVSLTQLQLANGDRGLHESEVHGFCWWTPLQARRRRHLVYGKAMAERRQW